MRIFRYIVQGFGWEIGAQVARESVDALRADEEQPPRERKRAERARRLLAKRQAAERKRQAAELERQLREIKKRVRDRE